MTTGRIFDDRTYPVNNGRAGYYYFRMWSGGDRSPSGRPTRPVFVPPFHTYASSLNLNRFRRSDRLSILTDVYSSWRRARESFFVQLKAYHRAKAEWLKATRTEMHSYDFTLVSKIEGYGDYWNRPLNMGMTNASLSYTFGWNQPTPPWTSNDDIALINKIQGKLDGGVGFHLGVAAAEVDQTFSMIRSNAKRFRRIGESLASGDMNKALRVAFNGSAANHIKGFSGLRGIADNYLLYQFGVKPLVQDVVDAARSYGFKAGRSKSTRVSVSRIVEKESMGPVHGAWLQSYHGSVRKSIVCYLNTDEIVDESGMFDIPSIMWERVPYSFVVDWWFNVGAYLQALHVSRAVSGGSQQFCVTTTTRDQNGPIQSGSTYDISSTSGGYYNGVRQVRSINSGIAVPGPSMRPLFHKDHEVQLRHTLEAISLITQKGPLLKRTFDKLRGT